MKNFKLLLATTAILSTGALLANADTTPGSFTGETTDMDVKVEIIEARSLSATALDFGRIVVTKAVDDISIRIDEDGNERAIGDGAYILKTGSKGVVIGATCDELTYADKIDLTKPAGATGNAKVLYINCNQVEDQATFYGEFNIAGTGDDAIVAGNYTGKLTVTVIPTIYGNGATASGD